MQAGKIRCVATVSLKTTSLAHLGHDSVEGSDFNMTRIILTAATMLFATLSSAFAHHPLGGEVPTTMLHGLLSGIGRASQDALGAQFLLDAASRPIF